MPTVFHTSQEADFKPGGHYYFGSVVFFSEEHYDRFGNAPHIYQAEIGSYTEDFSTIAADSIARTVLKEHARLEYGADAISDDALVALLANEIVCEEAGVDDTFDWFVQRVQAETAARMGYDAVKLWDEQGVCFAVDFAYVGINMTKIEKNSQ